MKSNDLMFLTFYIIKQYLKDKIRYQDHDIYELN